MRRRRRTVILLRNRIQFVIGFAVDALFAAARACNPNTWRTR